METDTLKKINLKVNSLIILRGKTVLKFAQISLKSKGKAKLTGKY